MRHEPSLDGLRALAVALVIADHAELQPFLGWGQIGVTVFFVLSGFLITSLLIVEHRGTGRVGLGEFYLRRGLRLLPALILLLVMVTAIMVVSGRGDEALVDVGSTLLYTRNWLTAAGENPGLLSHAWSLSIEEQFYIVWPIALIGLLAVYRQRLFPILVVLLGVAVAGGLWRAIAWETLGYNRALFGTDTRIDSLLIGCALAVLAALVPLPRGWGWAVAGLGSIALIGVVTDSNGLATWGFPLINLAAGMAIVGCLGTRVLAWRPLVYIGTISYGLYLFHRPIARAFVDLGIGGDLGALALIAGASIAIAATSYRYVERPVLRFKRHAAPAVRHDHHWTLLPQSRNLPSARADPRLAPSVSRRSTRRCARSIE